MSSDHVHAGLLSVIPALAGMTPEDVQALARATEQRELRRGDILVSQGAPSDVLYFVLSGRFAVHVAGTAAPIAEIGQGQPIGEVGFFAGLPRTATVVALRDSSVLAIARAEFQQIGAASPGIRDAIIVSLARRLAQYTGRDPSVASHVRTVAVMPAGASAPSPAFIEALRNVLGAAGRAMFLTEGEIAARFPAVSLNNPAVSSWLSSREAECDFIFYIAEAALTEWTRKCVRQADALLLVATAGAAVEPNPVELFAFSIHSPSARRLVILHQARTEVASGTGAWLDRRDVFMHHHVALPDAADMKRLSRFLAGRALGFVAGGGGALGSAHLGAYKAFCEAGAEFDILGGTSAGAAMAAALAYGLSPERVDEGTHNIFVKSRAFRRFSLPLYGLLDHKVFDRALQAEYRDVMIEDLWLPFFAVSSNLSDHSVKMHRRGPVWQAVRASGSIPALLPPFFTKEGEMLVDGALMDNVPLGAMKALKAGPNVIVAFGDQAPTTYTIDYDSIPGVRELAAAMLNPFLRWRLPPVPSIVQVIMLSMMANQGPNLELGGTDILIRPDLPADLRFTSWERHTEVFLRTYRGVAQWIEARIAQADPNVLAVLATACGPPDRRITLP
jgi:NTE family protein